jgi:hypothetical protein
VTYLLTWKGSYNDIKIARYASKADAKSALDGIEEPSIGGCEVDSELDLDYKKAELGAIFKGLGSEPDFKGFSTKAEGQHQVFATIEYLGIGMPVFASLPPVGIELLNQSPEAPAADEPKAEETIMATKKTKKPRKTKVKVVKAKTNGVKAKAPKAARAPRTEGITALITKMLERDRGATKKEIMAAAPADYDQTKLDNTVRGILSVMGRNTPKFKKAKDEKRGLVYSVG